MTPFELHHVEALIGPHKPFEQPPASRLLVTEAKLWRHFIPYYKDNVVEQAVFIASVKKALSLASPLDYPICFARPDMTLTWLPPRNLTRRETFTHFNRVMGKVGKCVWHSPSNDTSQLDAITSVVTPLAGETVADACRRLQAAYDFAKEAPEVITAIKTEYMRLLKRVRELENET